MGNPKPERTSFLLLAWLRRIRDDGAGGVLRPRTHLLPLLFLSALALWLVVSGVGSQSVSAAVTNRGFETGDLTGWSTGTVTESVTVVGDDTINADDGVVMTPLEGEYMARLGNPQPTPGEYQPQGPNELYQDFTISENALRFAYNIWTYDYTGYDEFRWEVRLTDTDTLLGSFRIEAWGEDSDISRKTSAWQLVEVDTSGYQGRPARLSFSARGTEDDLFAFWVYIDSAEETLAPGVVDLSEIKVNGYSPSRNQQTQTILLRRAPGTGTVKIAVPVTCPADCPGGTVPNSVRLIVSGLGYLETYSMTRGSGNIWEVTFPVPPGSQGDTFTLTLRVDCCGTIITAPIGSIALIDPSGFVTDAVTEEPIPEATVTLQRLDDSTWTDVNPFETVGDPPSPTINPQVNPQLTDDEGHYGWDVVAGTYRVVVDKEGYVTQTSPSVTVPPPVTDLDIELVPGAATRTLEWGPGWHNAVWTGASSTPEEAFSCAEDKYAAAYRLTAGVWEGYFPGRTDISSMTELGQYDAFLILITESVTCEMPIEAAPGTSRMLQWAAGWQNAGWTGADSTTPEDAFACADGSYAAAYRLAAGGWEGYFPGREDISTMAALDQYDAFLILITAPVSCDMSIGTVAPAPSPTPTPTPTPTETPTPGTHFFSGEGYQAISPIQLDAGLTIVTLTHMGSSNFIVWLRDSTGEDVELLVNQIGPFDGSTALGIDVAATYALDITADGAWTIQIEQLKPTSAPGVPETFAGTGPEASPLFWLDDTLTTFQMSHDGTSNFIVWLLDSNGDPVDLLVNEIGPFDGSTAIGVPGAGVYILDIRADGDWAITVQQ